MTKPPNLAEIEEEIERLSIQQQGRGGAPATDRPGHVRGHGGRSGLPPGRDDGRWRQPEIDAAVTDLPLTGKKAGE